MSWAEWIAVIVLTLLGLVHVVIGIRGIMLCPASERRAKEGVGE